MLYLHEHFFDLVTNARYFKTNDVIFRLTEHQSTIGLAFYEFDFEYLKQIISHACNYTNNLIVYVAEPFNYQLFDLLQVFQSNPNVHFFGDGVLNVPYSNWKPAICWFVTARHYYQQDAWAQAWLRQVDQSLKAKPFDFDCLLGIPRSNRDAVEQLYHACDFKHRLLYTYYKNKIKDGIWGWDIGDVKGSWESIRVADQYQVALSALVPFDVYNQSWHSIVTESTSYNEISHMTEKIAKPIMAERIFIVFAGKNYLQNLRHLGFRTFSDIIDESYDMESDDQTRYRMAWQQVKWLCSQDALQIRDQARDILNHNRDLFLTTDWQHALKQQLASASAAR